VLQHGDASSGGDDALAGGAADLVVLDATEPAMAVAEVVPVRYPFQRGRMPMSRQPARLHFPS